MCTNCTINLDQAKTDKFVGKMIGVFNGASLAFMTSIGYRTGLFDTMSGMEPSTSHEIARTAKLDERYVREWLGAMVTGGIINYDALSSRYHLPAEHAALLTRVNKPNNMAVTAQWFAVMGSVEDKIVDCFRNGGGVGYEHFNRFHEVMADESDQTVVTPLLKLILPLVPELIKKLEDGIAVADVGCGRGQALELMARQFPNSRFTGYDLSEETVERANAIARQKGLNNLRFVVRDAANIDEKKMFDLIVTFDAIHDQVKPDRVLANIHRALKDDGVYLMQDIAGSSYVERNMDHPIAPFGYTISCMHCMTVSLSQGGAGLGTMWGRELAEKMVRAAGFTNVMRQQLEHDIINDYYIITK